MKTRLRSAMVPAIVVVLVALAGLFAVVGVVEIADAEYARGVLDLLRAATSGVVAWVIWMNERTLRLSRSLLVDAQIERAAAEAARQHILMPMISVDGQMRITRIEFPKTTVEAGATAHYAIPRIRGFPTMRMRIAVEGREDASEVEVDWETGAIRIVAEEEMKDFSIDASIERGN